MKMRLFITILGLLVISIKLTGQDIHGFVIDSESELPLAYVNIGVMDIPNGTVTNESGEYLLKCDNLPQDCIIRISMIGYESQTYKLNEFKREINTIRLVKKPIELGEITIEWKEIIKKIGTIKTTKTGGVCGWGGTDFGKGHELGLLLELGNETVKIQDLNLKIRKQSFDTIVFRLHVRSIDNGLPSVDLLAENIYFPITKYSGWQKVDLANYNILASGDVVMSIEWIKISNVIEKNLMKMNEDKVPQPIVLFDKNPKSGTFYFRKGSEAKWLVQENKSPGFYVTIYK